MHMGVFKALAKTVIDNSLLASVKSAIIVPGLTASLKGMTQYGNKECYIIYHPEFEGVTVHQREDVSIT